MALTSWAANQAMSAARAAWDLGARDYSLPAGYRNMGGVVGHVASNGDGTSSLGQLESRIGGTRRIGASRSYEGRAYGSNTGQMTSRVYSRPRGASRRRARPMSMALTRRSTPMYRQPAAAIANRGPELKCLDYPATAISFLGAGTATLLFLPPQEGSGFFNRIGRRTKAKSVQISGAVYQTMTNVAFTSPHMGRIMVVYDRQYNGSPPSVADILLAYSNTGATSSTAYDGLNQNNRDRFLVLRDRRFFLPMCGVAGAASNAAMVQSGTEKTIVYNDFIKLKGLETHYKATSNPSVAGDISTGAFLIVVIWSGGADASYTFNYATRFRFFD